MNARIKVLPTQVANQIAAGEVIERPASVVKELLENAADAGSTQIYIEIGFGGLNHILVKDNGCGILKEDLPLTIASHATSKLSHLDDLLQIHTMGFRGEALASIASISRLTLTTKTQTELCASQLIWNEEGLQITSASHPIGTTILVRDLFYNAPVRKNFLKSEITEFMFIETVVKRFALSQPEISIILLHNGKVKLNLPASKNELSTATRLKRLFGKAFLEQAIKIHAHQEDYTLNGWISPPHLTRSQPDKQWTYINRRMIKDKLFLHAMNVAYNLSVSTGRYPIYLLYLTVLPNEIDVNVHPTKHEVRFSKSREVHDFIYTSVAKALQTRVISPGISGDAKHYTSKKKISVLEISEGDWVTVNASYALLTLGPEKYLVNVTRMRKSALFERLAEQVFPWPHRPLLLPLSISIQNKSIPWNHYQPLLESLGFKAQYFLNEIKLDAIPCDFPTLDLNYFFQRVFDKPPILEQLIDLMIQSDSWCLDLMVPEEKDHWLEYWRCLMSTGFNEYSILLNPEACERAFNV